jgi:hypothetical protein
MQEFSAGKIRLACSLACAGSDGSSRRIYRGFYTNGLWEDLAKEVARVGYQIDRNYYYLGVAAELTGNKSAAKIYFKLALSTPHKCSGSTNVCDGLALPQDINTRLAAIESQEAKEAVATARAESARREEEKSRKAAEAAQAAQAEKAKREADLRAARVRQEGQNSQPQPPGVSSTKPVLSF